MSNKTLRVFLDGTPVGNLEQSSSGNVTFTYDDNYRQMRGATPLSLSMPLGLREHRSRVVVPFLEGLLPDSPGRLAELGRQYQTSASNAFGLLAHVGRDAAGAIQILPDDEHSTDAAQRVGDVTKLDSAELAARVADVVDHADTWGQRGESSRWSLPGAQPKLALYRFNDGSFGVPNDSTPTTHILKPAVPPYGEHDVNEFVTMAAAAKLGLTVADRELFTTERGQQVFITQRYDRVQAGGRWHRLHQEDGCQALSVKPARKYQTDGGPGIAQLSALINGFSNAADRQNSQVSLFEAIVFNVAALCTDAHAKNFSFILQGGRAVLAPLYDLGTHAPYPHTEPLKSAMKVGDEYKMDSIGMRELLKVAEKLQLPANAAEARINSIRSKLVDAFSDAATEVAGTKRQRKFASTVVDAIAQNARQRGYGH